MQAYSTIDSQKLKNATANKSLESAQKRLNEAQPGNSLNSFHSEWPKIKITQMRVKCIVWIRIISLKDAWRIAWNAPMMQSDENTQVQLLNPLCAQTNYRHLETVN